jgi:hypothetical protein
MADAAAQPPACSARRTECLVRVGEFPIGYWFASGAPLVPSVASISDYPPAERHFGALSLYRWSDYYRAGIRIRPVVAGKDETKRQIGTYSLLSALTAVLLWPLGYANEIYGAITVAAGAVMIGLALRLRAVGDRGERGANPLSVFAVCGALVVRGYEPRSIRLIAGLQHCARSGSTRGPVPVRDALAASPNPGGMTLEQRLTACVIVKRPAGSQIRYATLSVATW